MIPCRPDVPPSARTSWTALEALPAALQPTAAFCPLPKANMVRVIGIVAIAVGDALFYSRRQVTQRKTRMLLTVAARGADEPSHDDVVCRALGKWRGSTIAGYLWCNDGRVKSSLAFVSAPLRRVDLRQAVPRAYVQTSVRGAVGRHRAEEPDDEQPLDRGDRNRATCGYCGRGQGGNATRSSLRPVRPFTCLRARRGASVIFGSFAPPVVSRGNAGHPANARLREGPDTKPILVVARGSIPRRSRSARGGRPGVRVTILFFPVTGGHGIRRGRGPNGGPGDPQMGIAGIACTECHAPNPDLFPFNFCHGACRCNGFGMLEVRRIVDQPDRGHKLAEGAIDPWTKPHTSRPCCATRRRTTASRDVQAHLDQGHRDLLLSGTGRFVGIVPFLKLLSQYIAVFLRQYCSADCADCGGEASRTPSVGVCSRISRMTPGELLAWVDGLEGSSNRSAQTIVAEIRPCPPRGRRTRLSPSTARRGPSREAKLSVSRWPTRSAPTSSTPFTCWAYRPAFARHVAVDFADGAETNDGDIVWSWKRHGHDPPVGLVVELWLRVVWADGGHLSVAPRLGHGRKRMARSYEDDISDPAASAAETLSISAASLNNIEGLSVDIPLNCLVKIVTGVLGIGQVDPREHRPTAGSPPQG